MLRQLVILGFFFFSTASLAEGVQSFYCPQNHKYIRIDMTPEEVIDACGAPLSRQKSNEPVMQKVPVQQLLYNSAGADKVFYGVWAIPTGINSGSRLHVNIMGNKVKSVHINGSGTNAFSICNGISIQVGDPASKVYSACGSPSNINNTYVNQPVQSNQKPEVWIYQLDQYQHPITLTFINGKLQSII